MRKMLWFILWMALVHCAHAQVVRIRINLDQEYETLRYQAVGEPTELVTFSPDSFPVPVASLETLDQLKIVNKGNYLQVFEGGKDLGKFPVIMLWCNDPDSRFNLILDRKKDPLVSYYDHLQILPGNQGLRLINFVHLENYARGVVQAEAGHHKSLEFFKVQAASARTYALAHLGKHGREGYDLCDQTHCQAYKGVVVRNPLLERAVDETAEHIIVDKSNGLIEAVFSANCGGFTANSEDVWIANVEYLRAVPDYDYCEGFSNHAWHLAMPKLDFLAKLGRYHKVDAWKFEIIPDVSGRVKRIILNDDPKLAVAGEELRRLFRLKSSRFHVLETGSMLFIEGTGFGHGVGMCQDGAYHLSEMGLDFDRIIQHYYQGVDIIPVSEWEARMLQPEDPGTVDPE